MTIRLPLDLRIETTPGDDTVVAVLRGPMVMAADLGGRDDKWDSPDPVLVGANPLAGFAAADQARARYTTAGVFRPTNLGFVPFSASMTGAALYISSALPMRDGRHRRRRSWPIRPGRATSPPGRSISCTWARCSPSVTMA